MVYQIKSKRNTSLKRKAKQYSTMLENETLQYLKFYTERSTKLYRDAYYVQYLKIKDYNI